jgi:hypothetical protein
MKLRKITGECRELTFRNGVKVLFSYADVVAAFDPVRGWMKTSKQLTAASRYSVREWLHEQDAENVVEVEQDVLDTLIGAEVRV